MGVFHQLKGMLRSQVILMKRNKGLTFIELFCPIILLLFYFLLRLSYSTIKENYKSKYSNDIEFISKYSTNLTNRIKSEEENSYDEINENTPLPYCYFLAQCNNSRHIAIIGEDFPERLLLKIAEHFWELDDLNINDIFRIFNTVEEFDSYISSKEYGTDEVINPKICFGISKIDKFKFGIHYNTINIDSENSNEVEKYLIKESPHIPESKSNKNEKIRIQENFEFFNYYKESGYLMVLKLISDYILQEITETPDAEINFSIIGMIYDYILSDEFHKFLYLLGFFLIISYSVIFSINIYREIHFRETKKKEYLKSMGMKERVFFLSSFIRSFVINIIHSGLGALMIKLVLKQSQYIYLALILFLFGLVIFSMTYFFQSFLEESRKGVILSLICYCIMSFLYLPINSPEINKYIIFLFCILFPPTNLLLGFNVFYIFEKEFYFFNNNVKLDVSTITINQMIIFLISSFFLYLVLGYIISQLFCYDYGVKRCSCRKRKSNDEKNVNNEIKSSDDLIEDEASKKEKDNDNLSGFGQNYIEDDDSNDNQHKPKANIQHQRKNLKVLAYDIMNTPSNAPDYKKKFNYLKKSLKDLDKNKNWYHGKKINDNDSIYDELEMGIEDMNEMQGIRNKRREIGNAMSNLKSDEYFINNNLRLSEIKKFIPDSDSFLSNSIKDLLTENDLNDTRLEKDEFKKRKDEIHQGYRLIINNLKKNYSENQVLNGLSFSLYENEIFGLLGENGAGKSTLISILSGLIEATDGSIKYKINTKDVGSEITNSTGIINFRKILGICPQNNNILFDELTVKENLEIFCLFKYDKKNNKGINVNENIEKEVNELIKQFKFGDAQVNCLAKDLSGGQKRKLCIAIACCGRSKVIILDEPTGGIDIASRKSIWEILKEIKHREKIILLITHFMDEASYLSDKIGILKGGKLVVSGTNRELIDKYGQYITIKINKKMEKKKAKKIVQHIKDYYFFKDDDINSNLINESDKKTNSDQNSTIVSFANKNGISTNILLESFKERIIIRIPTNKFNFAGSKKLLDDLEEKFNINNYSIVKNQLEDVFVNTINNKMVGNTKEYSILSKVDRYIDKYSSKEGLKTFINQLKISFLKRIRDVSTIISEIIFPLFLIIIACLVSYVEWLEDNQSNYIELNNYSNDSQIIFFEFLNISDFSDYYNILYSEASKEKEKLKNYEFKYLKNVASKDNFTLLQNIIAYMNTIYIYSDQENITNNTANFYLISNDKEAHQYEFVSFISTKQRHSPITFTNYLLSNIIKYEIKKNPKYKEYLDNVGIINSPFHLTYEEKSNKKSRNGFVLVFFISIALSLIPSNFIINIIREKENKSKHLQILSGLSIYIYWLNNYIIEILKYFFVSLFALIALKIFNFYEKYLITLFCLYGPALISFTYCISYFIESEGPGQTIVLLINLFFGALGGSAILILRTNNSSSIQKLGKIISYFFRLVPSFCISYGYNELLSKKLLFAIDNFTEESKNDIESFKEKYNSDKYIIDYIKVDFIYLSMEIIIYTLLLFILEQKDYLIWKFNCKKKRMNYDIIDDKPKYKYEVGKNQDEGIRGYANQKGKETSKRDLSQNQGKIISYPLVVEKIKKYYKNKINLFNICFKNNVKLVLDELSFKVEDGECFGFIGANGAGKTTTFKCLCQEEKPDEGYIKINNIDISDYSSKKKILIGYCPQFDSVFEHLTVEQNLYFYSQLKGIKQDFLYLISNAIMKTLDLSNFRDYPCKNLSGGNKRKLSVGISIICNPNVIFMDEPSTGMDPYTRRLLLNLLHKSYLKSEDTNKEKKEYKERAIILTTHSIEEVEALCDKIGILVNGVIEKKGKGTINDVVQNNSEGIELNIEFKKATSTKLKEKFGKILDGTINKKEIKKFLEKIHRIKYYDYIKKNNIGKDIYKILNDKKIIYKSTFLIWVTYLDYLFNLIGIIKQYFGYVECIDCKLNNFILIIKNEKRSNKCDSYIFGILEEKKEILSIEEYSYSLTTLETVFLKYCQFSHKNDKNGNVDRNNEKQKSMSVEL